MSSKITFENIIHRVVKSPSDITLSEIKAGKLQAGSITSKMKEGLKIDVLVLKNGYPLICEESATFEEENVRDGTRRTFPSLPDLFLRKGRLPVHTSFFKQLKETDTIEIILHN